MPKTLATEVHDYDSSCKYCYDIPLDLYIQALTSTIVCAVEVVDTIVSLRGAKLVVCVLVIEAIVVVNEYHNYVI